jgi:hypothetical protein
MNEFAVTTMMEAPTEPYNLEEEWTGEEVAVITE